MGNATADKKLYERALELWLKQETDMKMKRSSLYGMTWCYLSLESRDKVKGFKEYDVWSKTKDPEKLWQAVVDIHKVHTSSAVSEVKKRSAWATYANCWQGGWESLIAYKERHMVSYKT